MLKIKQQNQEPSQYKVWKSLTCFVWKVPARVQQGSGRSESYANQIPTMSPLARSKAKLQYWHLGRQTARYLYNLRQMNTDSRLTGIFKILFFSTFLIEIDKFSKKQGVFSTPCQCPYVPRISPQCSLRLEMISHCQPWGWIQLYGGSRSPWLFIQVVAPVDTAIGPCVSQYSGEMTQACLSMLRSSS